MQSGQTPMGGKAEKAQFERLPRKDTWVGGGGEGGGGGLAGGQSVPRKEGRKVNGRKEGTSKSPSFVCVVAVAGDSVQDVGDTSVYVLNFRKYKFVTCLRLPK